MDTNNRQVDACKDLLELCTACDPRWRLSLWAEEAEKAKVSEALIAHAMKCHKDMRLEEKTPEPVAKKPRVLDQQDSMEVFASRMQAVTSPSAAAASTHEVSLRDKVVAQWDLFFSGDCIPLTSDPYEWWRKQRQRDFRRRHVHI